MSNDKQTSCPHCGASFSVSEEHLRSADGMVRCGLCLKVFDANNGEIEFTAPAIGDEEPPNRLVNLSLRPMENAEIPSPAQAVPPGLKILLPVLVLLLAGQLAFFQFGLRLPQSKALSIGQLLVRAHPEQAGALRLDAILHNRSDRAQPYPGLFLYLDNRYGERRAQRLFLPAEYLPAQLVNAEQLPAHTRVQIFLELQDPGQEAVNYGLALHTLPTAEN
jgi:predicted Zn finger-like uncharacterized protein